MRFNSGLKKVMLVDAPIEYDRRVQSHIRNLGDIAAIYDINKAAERLSRLAWIKIYLQVFRLICHGLGTSLAKWRLLRKHSRDFWPDSVSWRGIRRVFRWLKLAMMTAHVMGKELGNSGQVEFFCNDLYCALAATVCKTCADKKIIYDSHELQIFRNRLAGLFAFLIEYGIESRVVNGADRILTVNHQLAVMIGKMHQLDAKIEVFYNDLYTHHRIAPPGDAGRPALVYIGQGTRGRRLEMLDRRPESLGFDVYVSLVGASLNPVFSGENWHFMAADYEEELLRLRHERRCAMWCCVDETVLSYNMATPNKFYQALAAGMPVIATRGTYLSEIVEKYSLGLSVADSVEHLPRELLSDKYGAWLKGIARFRELLRAGEVEL